MRTVEQHRATVAALLRTRPPVEVELSEARGLVLGADLTARTSLPPFENSAMDGYAVRAEDLGSVPVVLPVADDIPAGRIRVNDLAPGTAQRIMTGALLPRGADSIVVVEHTDGGTERVRIDIAPEHGVHIRHIGEDIVAGAVAIPAGTVLHPSHLGLAAAIGHATVPVHPRPRVVVLSTGSELREPGTELAPGQIYESNSALLCAAIEESGARARALHFVTDDLLISERGLLTRRVISTEMARIRGYTLSEGLGMRLVGAARLTALITGVTAQNSRSQLLPLGPVSEARSVADRAVRPFDGELRSHPRAALRRRLIRSVGPGLVVIVVGLILGLWQVWVPGLVLTVLGVPLGIDRYRSLGHVADTAGLAVRSGSLARQTTVLERRALVGWKVRQSFFQRRAGLVTVTALVGAGVGGYQALDAGAADALSLTQQGSGRWAGDLVPAGEKADTTG